jgi:DNA-binding NarL/FixJ family response regulator
MAARERSITSEQVLIVDDHAALREGIVALFQETRQTCGAVDFAEAVAVARKQQPLVVFLGVSGGQTATLSRLAAIRKVSPKSEFVLMGPAPTRGDLAWATAVGVCCYLDRRVSFAEIQRVARQALQRRPSIRTSLRVEGLREGDPAQDHTPLAKLTYRELQVLRLVAEGLSVRQCAEILNRSESTVDNHKARIMKKLGVHRVVELTRFAIREGLVSPE